MIESDYIDDIYKTLGIKHDYPASAETTKHSVLDDDRHYVSVDLLQHVPDGHVIKDLSLEVSKASWLPPSTVLLSGLACFSSQAAKEYAVTYRDETPLPIGLYTVLEQPSGTGKSRCLGIFQNIFYDMHKAEITRILKEKEKAEENEDSEKEKQLEEELRNEQAPFITNSTPEALEKTLTYSNGYFSCVSSEQGLFNTLFGVSYKKDNTANNNDVVLNGFDGGKISSHRVTRQGYVGPVIGGICCFAQTGSVEGLLESSKGTGLSERFLMLVEPHSLGSRDRTKTHKIDPQILGKYERKCESLNIHGKRSFEESKTLEISQEGFDLINFYLDSIEPLLADGGKYSFGSLRGAASKIDMQIMKIAANLHLLSDDVGMIINKKYVVAAIWMANELLNASHELCEVKGILGKKAEFQTVLRKFKAKDVMTEREIIQGCSQVKPFNELSSNKSEAIRDCLNQLVDTGQLSRFTQGNGKTLMYKLGK